jgi:hypothetical protein
LQSNARPRINWNPYHIILRKLFVVPVVFGAVWFGLRDAVTYTTAGWDKRFGLRDPLA